MTNLKLNKYYYIKHKYFERTIDRKLEKGWAGSYSRDVAEVLCDVPTYEELCIELKLIMDLSEENAQLKKLLIKCRVKFKTYAEEDETCGWKKKINMQNNDFRN